MHHQRRIFTSKPTVLQQVQRQMSDSALMHSNAQLQDTKAECITEYNLPTNSKFLLALCNLLREVPVTWQKQPCQLVESLCTEKTGLLLPELSSHTILCSALQHTFCVFLPSQVLSSNFYVHPSRGRPFSGQTGNTR